MNRLYVVEGMPTGTGAIADHRLPMRSLDVEPFARAVAARLHERFRPLAAGVVPGIPARWLDALARDLLQHHGASLVIPGAGQPPFVHAFAHAVNDFLGNVGRTRVYTTAATIEPRWGLAELTSESMRACGPSSHPRRQSSLQCAADLLSGKHDRVALRVQSASMRMRPALSQGMSRSSSSNHGAMSAL